MVRPLLNFGQKISTHTHTLRMIIVCLAVVSVCIFFQLSLCHCHLQNFQSDESDWFGAALATFYNREYTKHARAVEA